MDAWQARSLFNSAQTNAQHAVEIFTAAIVDCENIIEALLEVMAERNEEIERLRTKVNDLESRIAELEADE